MNAKERKQDKSPRAPLPIHQIKRSLSQEESLILTDHSREDSAKIKVYLEDCRKRKKKAEFDSFSISEEELRFAIEEIHEQEIVEELKKREQLISKVRSLQSENDTLSKKYLNDCSFLRSSIKNSKVQSLSGVSIKDESIRNDTLNQICEYGYSTDPYNSLLKPNQVKTNSSLAFSQSPCTYYNPEDTEKCEEAQQVEEYSYSFNKIDDIIQEETIDQINGEGSEGGVNKLGIQTVGNMAKLKRPWKYCPKQMIQMDKGENLEETARFSYFQSKISQNQSKLSKQQVLNDIYNLENLNQDKIFELKYKSRNKKFCKSQASPFYLSVNNNDNSSFNEAKQFQDFNRKNRLHQNSKWTLNDMGSVTTLATQALNSQGKQGTYAKGPQFDYEENDNVIIENIKSDEETKNDHFRHRSNITIGQHSYQPYQTLTNSSVVIFDALNNTNQGIFCNGAYSTERSNNCYKSIIPTEENMPKNIPEVFPQNQQKKK